MPADHSALLAHIVSQTRQNVEFLVAQDEISRDAGQRILAQLPNSSDFAVRDLSEQTGRMRIPSPPTSHPPVEYDHPPAPPFGPPARRNTQQPPRLQQAKALWAYNDNSSEPNDLSFHAGDIVEIVAETNADWWTGRINGKQGLFPSNYVEKIPSSLSPPSYPSPNDVRGASPANAPAPYNGGPPVPYQPSYNGPPQGYQSPPPQPYNPYMVPTSQPPQQQVLVQQVPAEPAKQSRFGGGLGRVLATSAVGGVGFGAGSAVGSGIVDAIF